MNFNNNCKSSGANRDYKDRSETERHVIVSNDSREGIKVRPEDAICRGSDNIRVSSGSGKSSSTPSRRIHRSGSTFGQISVPGIETKRIRQTPNKRQPSLKKDDSKKQSQNQHDGVTDSAHNSSGTASKSSECENDSDNNSGHLEMKYEAESDFSGEKQKKEIPGSSTSTSEHARETLWNQNTPERSKSRLGDEKKVDGTQSQCKSKIKSDRLMSLLRSTEIQVNVSTPSTSSPSVTSSTSTMPLFSSLKSDRKTEKDNMDLEPSTQKHKTSSLLGHRAPSSGTVDFTKVQPIPDETFLVSLSKDKNKELSMLTTTKGTVRVNTVSSKNHQEVTRPATIFSDEGTSKSSQNESKRKDFDRNILNSHVSTTIASKTTNHDKPKRDVVTTTVCNVEETSNQLVPGHDVSKLDCVPCDEMIETAAVQDVVDIDIQYRNDNKGSSPSDQKGTRYQEPSQTDDSRTKQHKEVKNSTPKPVSQYPLMEEILTDQSYHRFDKMDCIVKVTECLSGANSSHNFKLPSTVTCPILPPVEGILSSSTSKNIKRSERIRCKNEVDNPAVSPTSSRRSVISTMKPIDKNQVVKLPTPNKNLLKKIARTPEENQIQAAAALESSSTPPSLFPSPTPPAPKVDDIIALSASEFTSSVKKKKKKDKSGKHFILDASKKKAPKKGKDFSKAKACMSREVMDGIVRSIEETVSRIRESADKEEQDLASDTNARSNKTIPEDESANPFSANSVNLLDNVGNKSNMKSEDKQGTYKDMAVVRKKASISKLYKSKSVKSARKRALQQSKSKLDGLPGLKLSKNYSAANANDKVTSSSHADSTGVTTGKRFRKKTRKAEEALSDYDIFWEDEWPVKKPKAKRRSSHSITNSVQDTAAKIGQRRSRRCHEQETISSDPVLEEHAFILWASEHRSELELKFPNVSTSELDALLSAKWCDVTAVLKTKYFCRAKEAFSDDDRQRIWSNHSSYGDLDSDVLCGFIMDRDPIFSDFVRMPVHRQRDLLRKWLKFFQKMMPRKEYVEFMVSFKRACGRDDIVTKSGKPKRTHMRSIDPAHYKMLFDLIRLSKPRVLEVYRERRGKEKTMISNTYSIMLKHLVNNQTWPHMNPDCQSFLLTELFQDLEELDKEWEKEEEEERKRKEEMEKDGRARQEEDERMEKMQQATVAHESLPLHSSVVKDNDHSCYYRQPNAVVGMDVDGGCWTGVYDLNDVLDDDDLAVLDSSCAQGCLAQLEQLTEMHVLDQHIINEVFLTSTAGAVSSHIKLNLNINNYSDCHDQSTTGPKTSRDNGEEVAGSIISQHGAIYSSTGGLSFSDASLCPNINVRYHSSLISTQGRFIQNTQAYPNPTAIMSYKGNQFQPREGRIVKSRSQRGRPDAIQKTLVSYRGSMDNVIRYPSHAMDLGPSLRCIRVRSSRHSSTSQQLKMPFRPYQLPTGVRHRSALPKNASQEMYFTPNSSYNNKIPVEMTYRPRIFNSSSHFPLDSSRSASPGHLIHHRTASSRSHNLHHHGSSSPLITSLSSLRNIKSRTSGISYQAHQNCQMIPYGRSKLLCSSNSHQGNHPSYRRNPHSLPTCATGSKLPNTFIQNSSLQPQIKVCLPSQALKIPIAKLKGARKSATSYVRNRLKTPNVSLCNSDASFDLSSSHLGNEMTRQPSSENQSVLARVLSCQEGDENEPPRSNSMGGGGGGGFYRSMTSIHASPCIRSYMSPLRQVKDNVSIISTESRMDSKVQLISIIGNNFNNKNRHNYINSTMRTTTTNNVSSNNINNNCVAIPPPPRFRTSSPQKAIVVNPFNLHHGCPPMSRLPSCPNSLGSQNVRTTVKTVSSSSALCSEATTSSCVVTSSIVEENVISADTSFSISGEIVNKQQIGDGSVIKMTVCKSDTPEQQPSTISNNNRETTESSCNDFVQSSSMISQQSHSITTPPSSVPTSLGISHSQSVPLLLSPSQTLSHLLSTDSSLLAGSERCTCTACLSFSKKNMPKTENPSQASNDTKQNQEFTEVSELNDPTTNSRDSCTPEIKVTTAGGFSDKCESVASLFQGDDDANDSDEGREIKSISLHDAWDIPLTNSNSAMTPTINPSVRVSTPELVQPETCRSSPHE